MITPALHEELYPYIAGIGRGQGGLPLEIGGMADHLHVVVQFGPDVSVSTVVRLVKANSSKWANQRAGRAVQFAWQRGYGAFTVSLSQLAAVRRYVRGQKEHHRQRTFQEEFVGFLHRHGIEIDERDQWD